MSTSGGQQGPGKPPFFSCGFTVDSPSFWWSSWWPESCQKAAGSHHPSYCASIVGCGACRWWLWMTSCSCSLQSPWRRDSRKWGGLYRVLHTDFICVFIGISWHFIRICLGISWDFNGIWCFFLWWVSLQKSKVAISAFFGGVHIIWEIHR